MKMERAREERGKSSERKEGRGGGEDGVFLGCPTTNSMKLVILCHILQTRKNHKELIVKVTPLIGAALTV